jgi:hypothetical protein
VTLVGLGHFHQYQHKLLNTVHYVVASGAGGFQDPPRDNYPDQGIFVHFVQVLLNGHGQGEVLVHKEDQNNVPDRGYSFLLGPPPH